jgi:hypothetical protein
VRQKEARYLDLVDPAAFVERRSPEPVVNAWSREEPPIPAAEMPDPAAWWVPSLGGVALELPSPYQVTFNLPTWTVSGYDYRDAYQPHTVEVWIEKSTMNDILEPLCSEWSLNLVVGVGFASITRTIELLRERTSKPVRIFYISDFDHAGKHMPKSVARHIEYFCSKYASEQDIKLTPLALTKEQVEKYRLPSSPEGGETELDALEATRPGVLAQIIRNAVAPYFDHTLPGRLARTARDANEQINDAWSNQIADLRERLQALETTVNNIHRQHAEACRAELEPFVAQIDAIRGKHAEAYQAEMEPYEGALMDLRIELRETAKTCDLVLPDRPAPETDPPDESDWLFDAQREYDEQLEYYKR